MNKIISITQASRTKPDFIPEKGHNAEVVSFCREVQMTQLDIQQRYKNILHGYSGIIMRVLKMEIENISQNMKDASLYINSPLDTKCIFEKIVLWVVAGEDFCEYLKHHNADFSRLTQQNFIRMLDNFLPQLTKIMIFQYLDGKIRMNNNMPFAVSLISPHLYKPLENSAFSLIKEVYENFKADFPELWVWYEDLKNEFFPSMQYSIYGMIACYEYFIFENMQLSIPEKDFLLIAQKLLNSHKQTMVENILWIVQDIEKLKE